MALCNVSYEHFRTNPITTNYLRTNYVTIVLPGYAQTEARLTHAVESYN